MLLFLGKSIALIITEGLYWIDTEIVKGYLRVRVAALSSVSVKKTTGGE